MTHPNHAVATAGGGCDDGRHVLSQITALKNPNICARTVRGDAPDAECNLCKPNDPQATTLGELYCHQPSNSTPDAHNKNSTEVS